MAGTDPPPGVTPSIGLHDDPVAVVLADTDGFLVAVVTSNGA